MRDYKFGEWIAALRIANGYSQFQLGKLLGISDKAISKWENGAAKPRMDTCARMATLFGISLDDLLSCREHQESSRLYSAQSESEEELWQEAREKLHLIYGDNPPIAFQSRLDAEEMLMKGTGMIRHLKLEGNLSNIGIYNLFEFGGNATLVSWLMGASDTNPLQPHTVCPHCRNTVLHPEVQDGWDLPEEICSCRTPLLRDGHNIRLDLCEKEFVEMQQEYLIQTDEVHEDVIRQMVQEEYGDTWTLIEYEPPHNENSNVWMIFGHMSRYLALVPNHVTVPFPCINGIYQIPDDKYFRNLVHIPEVILYFELDKRDTPEETAPAGSPTVLTTDELLKPEILELARKHLSYIHPLIAECYDDRTYLCVPEHYDDTEHEPCNVTLLFEEEDITAYLPEVLTFSSLMRGLAITNGVVWHGYVSRIVMNGIADFSEFPASQEDLFDVIRQKLIQADIFDRGIAFRTISHMQKSECTEEDIKALSDLGLQPWLVEYIRFMSQCIFVHKESLISGAYYLLYRIAKRKAEGIDENDYLAQKKTGIRSPVSQLVTFDLSQYFSPEEMKSETE